MQKNCKELQGVVRQAPILILEEKPQIRDVGEYLTYLPVEPYRPPQPKILPRIGKKSVKVAVAGGRVIGEGTLVVLEMTHSILLLLVELLRMLRRPSGYKPTISPPAPKEARQRQEIQIEVNLKINTQ